MSAGQGPGVCSLFLVCGSTAHKEAFSYRETKECKHPDFLHRTAERRGFRMLLYWGKKKKAYET